MPAVPPRTFARLLRTLDGPALAAFVADLWAARGWETAVEGATVVARDPERDRRETVHCLAGAGREAEPTDVDVLVSARGRGAVPGRHAAAVDRVVGPETLRELLLYAVDRETAARVFAAHFDRPLLVEPPGPRPLDRLRPASPRQAITAGLVVALALALAIAATGGPVAQVGDGSAAGTGGTTATPVALAATPPPAGNGRLRYPPGLGTAGVIDVGALAAAHREAADQREWDLLMVHRASADPLHPDRRWVTSRQTVDRLNASRYWYRVTGLERTGAETFRSVVYDDYADGTHNFRRVAGSPEPTYRRTALPDADDGGAFAAVSARYVARYLDTTASRVEPVDVGGTTRYRVVATGTPNAIAAPVTGYTAVASVDRRGLVRRLTVEYTRADLASATTATPPTIPGADRDARQSSGTVRFRLVFRDIGDATVLRPAWYDEARAATNGTSPGPWPNDPGR